MTSEDKKKRMKGRNFSELEKELLIQIVFKYKGIIEDKQTNSASVQKKNEAWKKITDEFNSIQTNGTREIKNLKVLYDNLKMRARKEKIDDKVEQFKTGGGSWSKKISQLSEKIVGELSDQFEPLPNPHDSSSVLFENKHIQLSADDGPTMSTLGEQYENICLDLTTDEQIRLAIPVDNSTSQSNNDQYPENNASIASNTMTTEVRPSLKRKKNIYNSICEYTNNKQDLSKEKQNFAEKEHLKRMKILDIEEETAKIKKEFMQIKLENQLLKKQMLQLNFKNENKL